MCAACWRQVPREMQRTVYRTWRAWSRDMGDLDKFAAYREAADAATASVP